jgi:hypothetical protein
MIARLLFKKLQRYCALSTMIHLTDIRSPTTRLSDRPLSQRPDVPDAKSVDFKPGAVLGSVGLRTYLGSPATLSSSLPTRGAEFPLRVELPETVISQPFWPAYLTAGRIAKAKRLKLAIAAGLGSDRRRPRCD